MVWAAVVVHYHTPDLAARAVEALRAELEASGGGCEIVIVDNGNDEAGRRILDALPAELVRPGRNLGYAAAVNLGVERTGAERLLLMNPDVFVLPGCLAPLGERLEAGAAAAGPRFFWDRERTLLLPPTERRTRRDELLRRLAARSGRWARLGRARWRRHARRHWRAAAPFPSPALSGALLAVRRDAWQRVGPFDPGYRLYFEESDWLLRLARVGLRSEHVPAAEAVHLFARSSAAEPGAGRWFEESARRFARRHYGRVFAAFADRLVRGARPVPSPAPLPPGRPDLRTAGAGGAGPLWVEVSPSPLGFPAAAARLPSGARSWELPEEVWRRLAPGEYSLSLVDGRGRELARHRFTRPADPAAAGGAGAP